MAYLALNHLSSQTLSSSHTGWRILSKRDLGKHLAKLGLILWAGWTGFRINRPEYSWSSQKHCQVIWSFYPSSKSCLSAPQVRETARLVPISQHYFSQIKKNIYDARVVWIYPMVFPYDRSWLLDLFRNDWGDWYDYVETSLKSALSQIVQTFCECRELTTVCFIVDSVYSWMWASLVLMTIHCWCSTSSEESRALKCTK